jgi:hypothetical protein
MWCYGKRLALVVASQSLAVPTKCVEWGWRISGAVVVTLFARGGRDRTVMFIVVMEIFSSEFEAL